MATPTTPDRAASGVPIRAQEKGVFCDASAVTYASTATGEVTPGVKVASGTTVVDAYIVLPASLGAGTQVEVGDGGDTDRYILASTAATAGVFRLNNYAAGPYTYTADDTIDFKMTGGTATGLCIMVVFFTRELVDLA